ncbi:MAG TPA: ferritin-like domain-containing protein [Anaerolineaceae bacterium]|nr:ferritin-like domain-containing protein [Anaerolineaceae bacterium]
MTTFYGRKNVHVNIQPNIGLDTSARQGGIEILTILLADESVLFLKTRRACDDAKETDIPGLRSLYDTQSKQITAISKEITERIQILGGWQRDGSEELFDVSRLDGEISAVPDIVNILADHEAFIRLLREDARKCSEVYEDLGTFHLLVSILQTHEKMDWHLRSSFLSARVDEEK